MLLLSIAIVVIILLQEGQWQNLGAITGGADTFPSKNKTRSTDAFLSRWIKVIVVDFFVTVIAINVVMFFIGK